MSNDNALEQDLLARGMELRETHISRVFLDEHDVYKIKKPVDFGFLDFRTLESRERFCRQEVELNRRLAPQVYLGAVPVLRDDDGRHRFGSAAESPRAVDWAVHMRRLPDADAADRRLQAGTLGRAEVEALAVHIAAFHTSARRDAETSRYGAPGEIERNVRENFEQTESTAAHYLGGAELAATQHWQLTSLPGATTPTGRVTWR